MLPKPAVREAPYAALAAKTGTACRTAALQAQRLSLESQALRMRSCGRAGPRQNWDIRCTLSWAFHTRGCGVLHGHTREVADAGAYHQN